MTEPWVPLDAATDREREANLAAHRAKSAAAEAVEKQIMAEAGAVLGAQKGFYDTRDERQTLFFMDVAAELARARKKFPYNDAGMVALTEEVGELAQALLDESPERIYSEAVQVAAMAVRCALEGDPSLDAYRKSHQGVDALPARGKRP